MTAPEVTVVVVPRERFSMTARALQTLYENTDSPLRLVYVDGGSPPHIKRHLEQESNRRGFRLVREDRLLSPNQARNIGLRHVATPYVVFIDNDVLVTRGWLQTLLRCAEETRADIVGPLYLMGELSRGVVHMAGGRIDITNRDGRRLFRETHLFPHTPLASIGEPLRRRPIDVVEFHCMLMRVDSLERAGGLDEGLLSANEHVDVCLAVRQFGGTVYLEPDAVVSYIGPPPLTLSDLPFYLLRWSDAWNRASVRHFCEKWNVVLEPQFDDWLTRHRRTFLNPLHTRLHAVLGWRAGTWVETRVVHPLEGGLSWMVGHRRFGPTTRAVDEARGTAARVC